MIKFSWMGQRYSKWAATDTAGIVDAVAAAASGAPAFPSRLELKTDMSLLVCLWMLMIGCGGLLGEGGRHRRVPNRS